MGTVNWGSIIEGAETGGSGPALPAGIYDVRVKPGSKPKPTANGGEQILILMEIVAGPLAGQEVYDNLFVPDENSKAKAKGYFLEKLAAFGLTVEWLNANQPSTEQIAATLDNQYATIELSTRLYTPTGGVAREVNDVQSYKPYGSTGAAPAAPPAAPAPANVPQVPQAPVPQAAPAVAPAPAPAAPPAAVPAPAPAAPTPPAPPGATPLAAPAPQAPVAPAAPTIPPALAPQPAAPEAAAPVAPPVAPAAPPAPPTPPAPQAPDVAI